MPDRYGDDDRLAGTSLPQTVLVYSRTAALVRQELGLPAIILANYSRLDDLLSGSEVKLALYVNHNPQNFSALRFTSLAHVYLSHGESDKGIMVSNQFKAYDFWFVAGQAAIERISHFTMFYDVASRCLPIGRPQLDFDRPQAPPSGSRSGRPTVLYAPTWEGAQPSLAYGSLPTHGVPLVQALLASGRFAVAYRPHPLTGVTDPAHGDADAQVRRLVAVAWKQTRPRGTASTWTGR